jgi:hypothetical protein
MLHAHIDGSGSTGDSPVFVLAGYVASVAQWEAFSNDWQAALDLEVPRKLAVLKTNHAYRLNDPKSLFYGWTAQQRDARLIEFVKTINKHAMHGIVSVVPIEPYLRLFKGKFKPDALDRPYFISFFGILVNLLLLTRRLQLDDRIDFIFDEEGGESEALLMEQYRLCMSMAPVDVQNLCGGPPSFKKDHELRPLQAADMIAWHARRYYNDLYAGKQPEAEPSNVYLANLFLPDHDILDVWTEDRLREARDALSANINKLAWSKNILSKATGTKMTLPDPSNPWS